MHVLPCGSDHLLCPFCRKDDRQCDTIKLKHIMQQYQRCAITPQDDQDFQCVYNRRSCLFQDAYQQFSKLSFDETKMLKVVFVGKHIQYLGMRTVIKRILDGDVHIG